MVVELVKPFPNPVNAIKEEIRKCKNGVKNASSNSIFVFDRVFSILLLSLANILFNYLF